MKGLSLLRSSLRFQGFTGVSHVTFSSSSERNTISVSSLLLSRHWTTVSMRELSVLFFELRLLKANGVCGDDLPTFLKGPSVYLISTSLLSLLNIDGPEPSCSLPQAVSTPHFFHIWFNFWVSFLFCSQLLSAYT